MKNSKLNHEDVDFEIEDSWFGGGGEPVNPIEITVIDSPLHWDMAQSLEIRESVRDDHGGDA
jgi:hypothetical protein